MWPHIRASVWVPPPVSHQIPRIGVCAVLQHVEAHCYAALRFSTHQLEDVNAPRRHAVDVRPCRQRRLEAAGVVLRGINTVEQHT